MEKIKSFLFNRNFSLFDLIAIYGIAHLASTYSAWWYLAILPLCITDIRFDYTRNQE